MFLIMATLSILLAVTASSLFEAYGMSNSKFAKSIISFLVVMPLAYAIGFYFEETEK